MFRILVILTICLGISGKLAAQDSLRVERPRMNGSINILGDGSLFSFQIERLVPVSESLFMTGSIGLGYNEEFCIFSCQPDRYLTFPHRIGILLGKNRTMFEIGIGGNKLSGGIPSYYLIYPFVGIRRQPKAGEKMIYRFSTSVPLQSDYDILYSPIGILVGIAF